MNNYTFEDVQQVEKDKNVNNDCNIELPMNNIKDCCVSQELFSDDDHYKNSILGSPSLIIKNDCFDASFISMKTPILGFKICEETPGKASVPKTPTDLLPFIKKTSILWTSDMETPASKLIDNNKIFEENCDNTLNNTDMNNTTPNRPQYSVNYDEMKTNKLDITSPVLGGKKRTKRKVKRRILNHTGLKLDNNEQENSVSSNSDKVSEINSLKKNTSVLNSEPKNDILNIKQTKIKPKDTKENKNIENTLPSDKNSNTSTQDFFSNVSFSSIDQLCSAIQNDKLCPTSDKDKHETEKPTKTIENEINHDKINQQKKVSNDILERVAVIKRNQKPFRRSIDINHTILPKEVFSKSVLELELADIKINHADKKVTNIPKNLCQTSFTKFSCIENDFTDSIKKSFIQENETNNLSTEIPNDMMNDWDLDNIFDNPTENENILNEIKNKTNNCNSLDEDNGKNVPLEEKLQHELNIHNNFLNTNEKLIIENDTMNDKLQNLDSNLNFMSDGFSTARGKTIAVNKDKILQYAKIYSEMEKENFNDDTFLSLKKNNSTLTTVKYDHERGNFSHQSTEKNEYLIPLKKTHDKSEKSKILKLYQDLELEEFVKPNLTPDSVENEDGLITTGTNNNNSNDKMKNETHTSSKSDNNDDKNGNSNINMTNDLIQNSKENEKYNSEIKTILFSNEISNIGFSTATGKNIKINKEKENYYSKLYATLNDDVTDETSLLKIKTNLKAKSNIDKKMNNKTLVVFNKNLNVEKTPNIKTEIISNEIDSLNVNETHLPNIISYTNNKVSVEINNKSDISTVTKIESKIEKNKDLKTVVKSEEDIISLENLSILKDVAMNCPVKKFKRKLEYYDVKRPERCRSFGGFPVNSDSSSTLKLNKSDPNDESVVNHSLLKGMSVSQCFDSFSDSLLSKVEISHLNTSKSKTPDRKIVIQAEKKDKQSPVLNINCKLETNDQFSGFSFQECTESFRHQRNFNKFLNRQCFKCSNSIEVGVEIGQTISFSNQTSSKQYLTVQYGNTFDVKKCSNILNYELTELQPKAIEFKTKTKCPPNLIVNKTKKITLENVVGKRKYIDSDSDNTPLTTLKKPRIGCELQGRKLFSDESDEEENCNNIIDHDKNQSSLLPVNIQPIVCEEEEKDLSEERLKAILHQEKLIRNKKRIKIQPTMGSLLRQRLENSKKRISWATLVGDSVPRPRNIQQIKENSADTKILEITATNATCYKFLSTDIVKNKRIISLNIGDDGLLIFDETGYAGVSEFTNAFLAMSGVDPKLIPTGWIENHYRWIVWKLASLDRIYFKSIQLVKMLTPKRVMQELKYRYDREIDKAQRSCLRKILEKDDNPTRRMVLCISSIIENTTDENKELKVILGLPRWRVEATDGWYSVPLTIDNLMSHYITIGKIKEGTKIVTYGAELLQCERGFFPLEKPANVSLKIHTNCTRRAKWDAKLGYQKSFRPIPVKLRDIIANGGMVGETTAVAARVYPKLYREKTPDGQSIFRNAKSEEKAANAYQRMLETKVNAMYAKVQKNFQAKKSSDIEEGGEDSCEGIKQEMESEMRQDLPASRQVTSVLKVRLFDNKTTVILTIWGVDDYDDSAYDIKEGSTITIINSFAVGSRGGELNLTANRFTHIKTEPLLKLPYPLRACTLISDVNVPSFEPNFNEFDTVGVVVSSGPAPYGMKNFEMLNLAYPKSNSSESFYLSVLFWNGISSSGCKGMLTDGAIISCSNLEWRRGTKWSIAVAYCSERTLFTCNPRQSYLNQELRKLKALIQNPMKYAESCVKEVANELLKKPLPRSNQGTPTNWTDKLSLCNTSTINSPLDNYTPNKAMLNRRLEKLSRYGVSNETSPIVLNNSSIKVNKEFTPVTRKSS